MAYSGVLMQRVNGELEFYNSEGKEMDDAEVLVIGLNDYISNVHADYFATPLKTYEKTTTEYIIDYLKGDQSVIDYENCARSSR